jgi:hypothetical protein
MIGVFAAAHPIEGKRRESRHARIDAIDPQRTSAPLTGCKMPAILAD